MGFSESDSDPFLWKQADSFFRDMPLQVAIRYYYDTSYSIRCYAFLKILGINDSIAFSLLPQYVRDSTQISFTVGDVGVDISFNKFLTNQYELFIDSKYYWCDTLYLWQRNYFRKKQFTFTKENYKSWPRILTQFIEFLKPYNIETMHKLTDLEDYHGIEHFHGRNKY